MMTLPERRTKMDAGTGSTLQMSADLVPKFSGQDKSYPASRWVQEIEDNAAIFEWTSMQQLLVARRALVGTASLWLKSERPFKTWSELKEELLKEFADTTDSKTIHEMMSARKKKKDETCRDYLLVMKEMGKRGKMPDYVAIKYIVDGIVDSELHKMMLYGVKTYPELKEKLKIYESIKEKVEKVKKDVTGKQEKPSYSRKSSRCYNCGEPDHLSSECPNKTQGRKCFKCNNFGHVASDCKAGKNEEKVGSSSKCKSSSRQAEQGSQPKETKQTYFSSSGSQLEVDGSTVQLLESLKCHDVGTTGTPMCQNCQSPDDSDDTNENKKKTLSRKQARNTSEKPFKTVKIGENIPITALIDSGSDINLMSKQCYDLLGSPTCDTNNKVTMSGLGSAKVFSTGYYKTNIEIDDYRYLNIGFHIVPETCMPFKLIIGQEFLKNVLCVLNGSSVWMRPIDDEWLGSLNCFPCVSDSIGYIGSEQLKSQVVTLIDNYHPNQTKDIPIQLKIVLKDDVPVAQRPRRISFVEQEEVDKQVAEWLKQGIVRVSYSEYASPLVLVRKKDGTTRICVDYRRLNEKIVKDEFPLPLIEDYIDKLAGAKVFSVLDLKNGFFHLRVDEDSVKYTSFVTHNGQYEFLRAPFGLSVCPKYFMRFITYVFRDLIAAGKVMIFIDDILIPAEDEYQAVERLKEVLEVSSQYGLQFSWKKADLVCRKITYLGHVIEDGKVRPSSDKTDAVIKFPEPKTVKQLHSFVGLASYFRKYIQDFALIVSPLTNLLKKDTNFKFNEDECHAFNTIKNKLANDPVLKIFNPKLYTELHTDACCVGYAAILMQRSVDDQQLHPVYYMSRKTTDAESRYTSYELEALAVIEGVKKFRHYLFGKRFKIITDCRAFQMTLKKKELGMSTRVARWILFLQDFDFTVEHREGSSMRHADALSRNPYVAVINELFDSIRQAQQADEGLKAITSILQNAPYDDYVLDNGLVYKGADKKLVVPRSMEDEIINRVHLNGHFSKKKMLELLDKDYFIKNVSKKVEEFLLTCIPCLLASRKEGKQEGFLHVIDKEAIPLHTLHVDHIGPMSDTKKQYNHILTVVDGFTKFVWIFPTKSTTSKETLDKLRIHQQQFGNPSRIVTDRGTAFTSTDFQDYCKEEGIVHVKITTGMPRGNGQVERIHRIIISILSKLCIEDPTLWYRHVSRVQRAINSTYQRSTGTTPHELLVGVKMKTKEDVNIYELLQQEERDSFILEREELRQKAKEQILKVQEENIRNYNKKRKKSIEYKEGDKVAIRRTQFGTGLKIKPKYFGPYKVTKVKGKDRYDVEKCDSSSEGPNKTSTAADSMKLWPTCYER